MPGRAYLATWLDLKWLHLVRPLKRQLSLSALHYNKVASMSMKVAPRRQRRSPESEAETVRAGPGRAKPCSTVKAEAAHHSVPQWPSLIKQHRKTPAHCPV